MWKADEVRLGNGGRGTINEELLAARGSWVDRPIEERKPYG